MQNFGKIKHTFNSLLAESLTNNDSASKLLFKEYLKSVKNSEILKTQFNVYYNLEHKHESDSFKSSEYIKENISLIQKYGAKAIIEENKKLVQILEKKGFKIIEENYPNNELHENITKLIFTEKKSNTIDTLVESLNNVMDYVKNNVILETKKREIIPTSILGGIMVDKFNEKYSELNEDTQKVIKSVLNSDESGKIEIMENLKVECIDLVNEQLKEADDLDYKSKLDTDYYSTREEFQSRL